MYSLNRNAQGPAPTVGRSLGPQERVSGPLADRSVDATTRDLQGWWLSVCGLGFGEQSLTFGKVNGVGGGGAPKWPKFNMG